MHQKAGFSLLAYKYFNDSIEMNYKKNNIANNEKLTSHHLSIIFERMRETHNIIVQ